MVEKRNCSFCGDPIEPGTGKMYIKKDGTVYSFCSNKCKKNRIDLGRVPRRTRWTVRYSELKASTLQREKAKTEPKGKKESVEEDGDPRETGKGPKKKPVQKKKVVAKATPETPKVSTRPVPVKPKKSTRPVAKKVQAADTESKAPNEES